MVSESYQCLRRKATRVLILVVVEDGLRDEALDDVKYAANKGLNPCSCGRWSQRLKTTTASRLFRYCLNPCCCGGWSQSAAECLEIYKFETCLNPCSCGRWLQSGLKSKEEEK